MIIGKIGSHELCLAGRLEALLLWHKDTPGFLAHIAALLACVQIDVATSRTSRTERGEEALTAVEIDGELPVSLLSLLHCVPTVIHHTVLPVLPGY